MTASAAAGSSYQEHVNPQCVRLLEVLQMNVRYVRCAGAELHTGDGRQILDFLSGYCVHNAGHNHPDILEALREELDRSGSHAAKSCAGKSGRTGCQALLGRRGETEGVLLQLRQRGHRSCHQVRPRAHAPQRFAVRRRRVPRAIVHTSTFSENGLAMRALATLDVVEMVHASGTFWSEALGLAGRVMSA